MSSDAARPHWREDEISQIPALALLINLGWEYLTPAEALELRGGRTARAVLTGVLAPKLRELNKIRFKGETWEFSEGNIQSAIQALEDLPFDGLVRTNERAYDLLRLGKALPQLIQGDARSFPLHYLDWDRPAGNAFHVTEEFPVERTGSGDTARPDLVLFVNGIPFAVIECKKPSEDNPLRQAIEQQIRNQKDEYIPRLFVTVQLLLGLATNQASYATVGTSERFWSVWREELDEAALRAQVNRPLDPAGTGRLFGERDRRSRQHFEALQEAGREVTEQDRLLYALCRPERLLEISRRFILFEGSEKKVARYQQYFCVRKAMDRLRQRDSEGRRLGGVVWHTQGSGKSLTMVMLANAIADELDADGSKRVVLVTDRVDLDRQIEGTFHRSGLEPVRARTGKHLGELLQGKTTVITTVIDKFEALADARGVRVESPDIFVLVDESHRGQYGQLHARMRRVLPNACFLGFTGTPVARKEKNTIQRFGGLIDTYTITEAVRDKAVVPLLYEGRHVDQMVDREQIDRWFERITANLSPEQAADLKRKFSSTAQLSKAEQRVAAIAWDLSTHFADNWLPLGMKGQLVAQDKATAILFKKYLDECGLVTSEVLISAPDDREGDTDILEENNNEVVAFWRKMMTRFGTEEQYNRQLIAGFRDGPEPDIIIVVDKLTTGFDAPRNSVLYLTRKLQDYKLLQTIARVNRVYEGKDFGYVIDYAGVLQNLDRALDVYGSLAEFEATDLEGTVTDVAAEVANLPQRHSDLWGVFRTIRNKRDQEAYERLLADEVVRKEFYHRLAAYARTFAVAVSSAQFLEQTPAERLATYKNDLRFFEALRRSVRLRYAEVVDFGAYEARIQKLLDRHVGTGEVQAITPLVDILDKEAFARELARLGSAASKADTIAYRTRRTITERMDLDPAFYKRFSELLEQTIAEFRAERISEAEYLRRVTEHSDAVSNQASDQYPAPIRYSAAPRAFYGLVKEQVQPYASNGFNPEQAAVELALAIDRIVEELKRVNWTDSPDVQNQMRTAIEDELFALKDRYGLPLTIEQIDEIMERCLSVAKVHKP